MSVWMRSLLILIGWIAVILGVIGLFLPVLPTTPFLILAASCFAKSSDRFYSWLLNSPLLGTIIKDWRTHRSVDPRIKRWAICVVTFTFGVSIYVVPLTPIKIGLALIMAICLSFIWRLKARKRTQAE